MKNLILILASIFVGIGTINGQSNLIKNGSFDGSPSYKDWTISVVEPTIADQREEGNPGGYVWLNYSGGYHDPVISQVITGLTVGTEYLLTGDYKPGRHAPIFCNQPGKSFLGVYLDDNPEELADFKLPNPVNTLEWSNFAVKFKATKTSHKISFKGEIKGNDADAAIDNIKLIEVKEIKPDISVKGGNWSYGYGTPGDAFTEFESEKKEGDKNQITRLHKTGSGWWSVAQNTSEVEWTDGHSITYPIKTEGAMVFHPGPGSNESAKVRFTASSDGTYEFTVKWTLVDKQGEMVSAEVYTDASSSTPKEPGKNFSKIVKEVLSGTSPNRSLSKGFKVDLKKGEWVSIEVENENGHSNDSTLVEMSVE